MTERVGLAKAIFSIKQGDTEPPIRATLRDGAGDVIDLSAADVMFHMKSMNTGLAVVNAAATVLAPGTAGRVEYSWLAGDTDEAGWMAIDWEIDLPAPEGQISVPNFGYDNLLITAAIA